MAQPERSSAIYRYEDADGTPHYVNGIDQVPPPYRRTAVRVDTDKKGIFVYEDASGNTTIVDRWTEIPAAYRDSARRIDGSESTPTGGKAEKAGETSSPSPVKAPGKAKKANLPSIPSSEGGLSMMWTRLDPPSVLVGVALALVLYVVATAVRGSGRWLLKMGLMVVIAGLIAGAYLGWARRSAGLTDAPFAHPGQVLEDARRAASDLEGAVEKQKRMLKKIEEGKE